MTGHMHVSGLPTNFSTDGTSSVRLTLNQIKCGNIMYTINDKVRWLYCGKMNMH